jgi:Nucleoside 2-deoxyribosyltransferase
MTNNLVSVALGEVKNTCFVIMPLHSVFEAEYQRVIKPAIEDAGLECKRGDEIYTQQAIVHDIWQSIREARVVIAELSGRNPNVMYEIGLAHAIGKPIVLLTRNQDDVPFDLKALRYLFYDTNNPDWGPMLRTDLLAKIRGVIDSSSLASHLGGITVSVNLPVAPDPVQSRPSMGAPASDISGSWTATWLGTVTGRRHEASLVIPRNHGGDFVAMLIVTIGEGATRTIVQETLTGAIRDSAVSLTGVAYSFLEQGAASSYSLDSFELLLSDDGQAMRGRGIFARGNVDVAFTRLSAAASATSR